MLSSPRAPKPKRMRQSTEEPNKSHTNRREKSKKKKTKIAFLSISVMTYKVTHTRTELCVLSRLFRPRRNNSFCIVGGTHSEKVLDALFISARVFRVTSTSWDLLILSFSFSCDSVHKFSLILNCLHKCSYIFSIQNRIYYSKNKTKMKKFLF